MTSPDIRFRPSVTVAAVIWRDTPGGETEYLLVEEETPEGLRLNNPAGHLEQGESPQQGVAREVLEETGREFRPESVVGVYLSRFRRLPRPGRPAEDITYVRFAYAGTVGERPPGRALDAGIVGTLWLTWSELQRTRERHRSPLVLRCVADHRAGRRLPLEAIHADVTVFDPEVRP